MGNEKNRMDYGDFFKRPRPDDTAMIEWDIDGNFPVFTRDYFRITGASQKKADWETEVENKNQDDSPMESEGDGQEQVNVYVSGAPYTDAFMMNQHAQQFNSFEEELRHVINKWSKEQGSGTPDFILAKYLAGCMSVLDGTLQDLADWRGEPVHPFAEPLRTGGKQKACGNPHCPIH